MMSNKKKVFTEKIFWKLKKIYLKLPFSRSLKVRAKNIFYRIFGGIFKNTESYQQWIVSSVKVRKTGKLKIETAKLKKFNFSKKIAIHLHLFYDDLMDEFVTYFKNMPYEFDLYISVIDKKVENSVREKAAKIPKVKHIIVKTVENRGRDVAPLLCVFGQDLLKYDYFCHVHTKKSLFTGSEQMSWRKHLLNHLFGSETLLKGIFYWFENGDDVGMVYPETYPGMPYWGHTWLQNTGSRDELLHRIGVGYYINDTYIEYPMGTMFWARVDALHQFFEAKIKVSEFPKENGQTDGTIAHAFERCLVPVCRINGYNTLIFDERTGTVTYNKGKKNFDQYYRKSFEQMKEESALYKIISFDIFDTLVSRVVVRPDDAFDLLEVRLKDILKIDISYKNIRKQAEELCRHKNPSIDCDLDEIYKEFVNISGLSKEVCEKIKALEVENELKLIFPCSDMIDFYNYVVHVLKKKVVIITDMYLRRIDIERILDKCEIRDYNELWLSSEKNLRKDNGTLWKAYIQKYKAKECMHIGDNEKADIQLSGDYGIHNYHIMSLKNLFECSNMGEICSIKHIAGPADSIVVGLVLKKLFNNPFCLNKTEFEIKIKDEEEFGYTIIGPVVLGYMNYLCRTAINGHASKVLFFAREGYLLKELFDIIKDRLSDLTDIAGEYIYVSRRALSVAAIQKENDIFELLDIYYRGTFKDLLFNRFGIEDVNAQEENIELPEQKEKVVKMINVYRQLILQQAQKERDNYLKYYETFKKNGNNKTVVSDIGYSGTIQYYLSKLTGDVFDGCYFATDAKKKPLLIDGNTINGFYIDNDSKQAYSSSYIHRYHLILESILIAPVGQFVSVDDNGRFHFITDNNPQFTQKIAKIHNGIKAYFKDFYEFCGSVSIDCELNKTFMEGLIHAVIECNIIEENLEEVFVVEDTYCSDSKISVLEHYRTLEENR